jgi:hypothetical protein
MKPKHVAIIGNNKAETAILAAIESMHQFEKINIICIDSDGGSIHPRIDEMNTTFANPVRLLPYYPPLSRRERRKLARKKKK